MVSWLLKLLLDGQTPSLGQAGFGEGVFVGGAGFGFAADCGEEVALNGVGGGAPTTRLLGGINPGESIEGIIVFALAGKDAGGLLDGAEFLGSTDTFLTDEILAIGSEGARVVLEIGFAVVPEVDEDADA